MAQKPKFDITDMNDPRVMGLMGLATGLLQSSGYSHRPISFGEALGNGMQQGMQGYMMGQNAAGQQQELDMNRQKFNLERQQITRKLEEQTKMQDVMKKFSPESGTNTFSRKDVSEALIATGMPGLIDMGLKMAPKVKSTQKGRDERGNAVYHNVLDSGEMVNTGIVPAEKAMQVNQGSQISFLDPYSLQQRGAMGVGMAPGESARLAQSAQQHADNQGLARQNAHLQQQKLMLEMDPEYQAQKAARIAGAREQAIGQAKGSADLPNAILQGEDTLRVVDDLLAHPGFKLSVGKSAPIGKIQSFVPGTDAASFDIAMKQLEGKQFLQAFESLKGGGQITEIEGQKATQAMSRMNKANSEEEFKKAAAEFKNVIQNGMNRARLRAGQQPIQAAPQPAQQNNGFSIRRID